MSVIFEGVEMPTACCFVDGEHSAFAHFEYCKFYNVCKQRETVKSNYKPSDCPVKALEQEPFKPIVEIDLYSVIKQKYIEREDLDKIRAEIESIEHYGTNNGNDFWLRTPDEIKKDVLTIIDKYKAEQER